MAFVCEPWVQETTNTTGTSDFTLNGAVSNYRAFSSVMSNGDTTVYVAVNGSQRERGIGELDGTTLKRTQVLRNSSGTTSKISFSSAGTRVFIDHPYSVSFEVDQDLTTGQQDVARSNLRIAATIETKSADYTAVAADRAKMLVFSAAATLSLTAAATLGADWPIHVRNESTGDIIIDPDSSETVDGLATVRIPPGYTVAVWCDGTSFYTDLPNDWLLVREEIVSTPVEAIAFTGLDPYKDVRARCSVRPSANAKSMYVRFSLDNGANWLSGAASYANAYIQGNSGSGGSGSAIVGHYNAAQLHTHNHDHLTDSEHLFDFFNFNKSRETFGYTESNGVHNDGTQYAMTRWLHRRFGAEAHNAIMFFWADAANFQVGSYIQLYGRRG